MCVEGGAGDGGVCAPGQSVCTSIGSPLLCDGFEAGAVDSAWDPVDFSPGTRAIVGDAPAGCGALAVSADASPFRHYVERVLASPPIFSGDLYVRTWIRAESAQPINEWIAALFIAENTDPFDGVGLHIEPGPTITLYAERDGAGVYERVPIEAGAWTCVEIHFEVSSAGVIELFVGGTRRARFEGIDLQTASGYRAIGIGVLHHGPMQGATRLFFDDVVVDDAPIGC